MFLFTSKILHAGCTYTMCYTASVALLRKHGVPVFWYILGSVHVAECLLGIFMVSRANTCVMVYFAYRYTKRPHSLHSAPKQVWLCCACISSKQRKIQDAFTSHCISHKCSCLGAQNSPIKLHCKKPQEFYAVGVFLNKTCRKTALVMKFCFFVFTWHIDDYKEGQRIGCLIPCVDQSGLVQTGDLLRSCRRGIATGKQAGTRGTWN